MRKSKIQTHTKTLEKFELLNTCYSRDRVKKENNGKNLRLTGRAELPGDFGETCKK